MKTLNVSAGGRGERIADYIASFKPFLPKHLLPIPTEGKTLLGEIVLNALRHFEEIKVWASKETYPHISLSLERPASVKLRVDAKMTGPLGPMIRSLISTRSRTFGCAGDFYCNFSWTEFEKFHDLQGFPVSILVAKSIPAPGGARFHVSDGNISAWERVGRTTKDDRINIGCYIVDPVPEVLSVFHEMTKHKEDPFFDALISRGLVSGYDPGKNGFNINVAEAYESLLHALA
jgi:NDP-sugar pyrophosphorylase family protein